jgi:hypothetical protein
MMLDSIGPEGNGGQPPLPAPNVVVARAGTPPDRLSPEAVKGLLVNLVEDAAWVRACAKMIEEEGAQPSLVNLPYVLRECFPGGATG